MKKSQIIGILSLGTFVSLPSSRAETGDYIPEPLLMRSQALGQLLRTSPYLQRFRLGEEGASRVSLSRGLANFWGYDKRYIVDAETRDDVLRVHYQPGPQWEVYGAMSERGFIRSGTDGVAMGFHRFFGLPQDGRLEAPKHATRISVPDLNLNYSSAQSGTILSRQFEAGVVFDLDKFLSLGFSTTLSTFLIYEAAADHPYFSDSIDGGARLSLAKGFGKFSAFWSLSLGVFDQKQEVQIASYEQQWGGIVGAAWRFSERHEFVTQVLVYQPIFQNMGQLSRESYEVHAAYRYNLPQVSFEVGLVENVFWVYNSPDWGISAGLSYEFAK